MNIIFICTWNIFRSMSAEYLTKQYLQENNIKWVIISSAGTTAEIQLPFPQTVERLKYYNCNPDKHIQRKINKEILEQQDIIICMAEHHKKAINELGFDAILFNEIAFNKNEDVMDEAEFYEKYWKIIELWKYVYQTVDYIHDSIPYIIQNSIKKI